jgi:hypothetical protein
MENLCDLGSRLQRRLSWEGASLLLNPIWIDSIDSEQPARPELRQSKVLRQTMVVALVRDKDKERQSQRSSNVRRDAGLRWRLRLRWPLRNQAKHQQESSLRGSTKTLQNIPAYRARLTVTGSSPHDQMLRALFIPPPSSISTYPAQTRLLRWPSMRRL